MEKALAQIFLAGSNWDFDKAIKLAIELKVCEKICQENPDAQDLVAQTKQNSKKILDDLSGIDKNIALAKAVYFYLN